LLPRSQEKAGQVRQASLADVVSLVAMFLLVCTLFAVNDGLVLEPTRAEAGPAGRAARDLLTVTALASGRIEIDGRPASLGTLKSSVQLAMASNDRTVILVQTDPGASYELTLNILSELKLAGARRVSLKERRD
jgi:biopolymer transport protein ExbD